MGREAAEIAVDARWVRFVSCMTADEFEERLAEAMRRRHRDKAKRAPRAFALAGAWETPWAAAAARRSSRPSAAASGPSASCASTSRTRTSSRTGATSFSSSMSASSSKARAVGGLVGALGGGLVGGPAVQELKHGDEALGLSN